MVAATLATNLAVGHRIASPSRHLVADHHRTSSFAQQQPPSTRRRTFPPSRLHHLRPQQ
ncbi:hypothetical protein DEO72_LG11g1219 [Vigna unguiculata]|uniref:Uncharacterized protein n=1 Tax=Vigna unguiculata TaxID=3917 RepID=A0A4D6NKD6_VIGUN|nr:hypothetical protein DEO72_LG11g1219 [Vigna unguiculata]